MGSNFHFYLTVLLYLQDNTWMSQLLRDIENSSTLLIAKWRLCMEGVQWITSMVSSITSFLSYLHF